MRHTILANVAGLALVFASACQIEEASRLDDPRFPLLPHTLLPLNMTESAELEGSERMSYDMVGGVLPVYTAPDGQIATGEVQGSLRENRVLEQPIGFSHYIHATTLGIQCEFCHSEARKSIHAGVPPVQTCMNCHRHVKTELPEVQKIHQFYCGKERCGPQDTGEAGVPIPWNKVHDLPDYVHFSHKRHVRAGVDCTECHGQVQLQGQKELVRVPTDPANPEAGFTEQMMVKSVMARESTLQMGWCLDCHASHPSIDANYGELADLRRAELKDCWTCHK